MRRKSYFEITQDEVSTALAHFLKQGGIITHLPEQRSQTGGMVGGEKYMVYEALTDLSALAGSTEQVN